MKTSKNSTDSTHTMNDKKKQFFDIYKIPNKNTNQMNTKKYNDLVQQVKDARNGKHVINKHWLLKHYDVLTTGGKEHLIFPVENDKILYYLPTERVYDILFDTHRAIGHGGRDKMRKELQKKYKNITYQEIQKFLDICEPCLHKRKTEKKKKKGSVVKPMVFSDFNSRCQVDLIDYESQADGEYKFIMVYQDHLTKFVILRALKSKNAEEVASHILKIFYLFGAPATLQTDNGREFCNDIIDDLQLKWPGLKIIHGKPQHRQLQGSVERANQDIKNMLTTWMLDQRTNNWSKGLGHVQFMKNRAFHSGIKLSPYEAMFGQAPKVGLSSSNLPFDVIEKLNTQEDLETVLAGVDTVKTEVAVETEDTVKTEYTVETEDTVIKVEEPLDDDDEINDVHMVFEENKNYGICTVKLVKWEMN